MGGGGQVLVRRFRQSSVQVAAAIRLALPEGAQFSLNASTGRGSISNAFGGGLKLETNGRSGSLRGSVGGGPAIELETQRGDITIQKAALGTNQPLEKLEQ